VSSSLIFWLAAWLQKIQPLAGCSQNAIYIRLYRWGFNSQFKIFLKPKNKPFGLTSTCN